MEGVGDIQGRPRRTPPWAGLSSGLLEGTFTPILRDIKRIRSACREEFSRGGEEVKCLPTYLMVTNHALLPDGEGEAHSAGRF